MVHPERIALWMVLAVLPAAPSAADVRRVKAGPDGSSIYVNKYFVYAASGGWRLALGGGGWGYSRYGAAGGIGPIGVRKRTPAP